MRRLYFQGIFHLQCMQSICTIFCLFGGEGKHKRSNLLAQVRLCSSPLPFLPFPTVGNWNFRTVVGTPTSIDLFHSPIPSPATGILLGVSLVHLLFVWKKRWEVNGREEPTSKETEKKWTPPAGRSFLGLALPQFRNQFKQVQDYGLFLIDQ